MNTLQLLPIKFQSRGLKCDAEGCDYEKGQAQRPEAPPDNERNDQ